MGSPKAHRSLYTIIDRPTHHTFVREKWVQERMEKVEDETFANILMDANDEWELLVPNVCDKMNFEYFFNQRREHYASLR